MFENRVIQKTILRIKDVSKSFGLNTVLKLSLIHI